MNMSYRGLDVCMRVREFWEMARDVSRVSPLLSSNKSLGNDGGIRHWSCYKPKAMTTYSSTRIIGCNQSHTGCTGYTMGDGQSLIKTMRFDSSS